jgi:hypothetical protein
VAHILILYKLKDGISRQDFEHWLETSSAPTLRGVKRLKSVSVYRAEKRVMSAGALSVDYVELFDIPDMAGFVSEDIPSAALRKDMEEFQGFAQSPEYLLATSLI